MASSPEPSQLEDDNNDSNSSEKSPPSQPSTTDTELEPSLLQDDNNNNTEISPPPPPTTTNATDDDVSPSPSTSPTPDQSPPPPPSPSSATPPPPKSPSPPPPESPSPPPPESPSPPPPAPPPPETPPDEPSPSPPPPDTASPPPPASSPPPPAASPPPPSASPSPPAPANSTAPRGSPPPITGSPRPPTAAFSPPPPGALSSQTPPPRQPSGNGAAGGSSSGNPSPPSGPNSDVAIIAGVIVGGIAILALIIICLTCSRKKKKQRYYIDPGRAPAKGGDQFYNDPTQWQSPRPGDQIVNLPPPPGYMVPAGTGGAWGAPPPLLMANTSSEFSSSYSGPHPTPMQPPSPSIGTNMSQFRYDDLLAATGGFSQANLLGQGGFGYVYKGVLPDKREVAVKSLKTGSGQGEREFQAEVEIISRVHHRHLVSLVGYCIANEQRLLVYEYVANKTLEFHLHGKGQPVMAWSFRLKIAVGSAKGLAYLHEDCHPRIIHRDIKAANILLDNNFEAMVADFGLAKLTSDNYTHVSTRVMGTFGYLAPEYASSGKLTEKSDVFSFGVMLLELITGRRPVDTTNKTMEDSLVDWARPLLSKALEDGNYNELVDPRLEGNYVTHELSCMVACAAASIRHSARRRPKMSQIAHALEGDSSLDDLNDGVKPGQSKAYNPTGTGGEAYDTMAYNADMLKFKKMVLSSQEFNSSEYGTTGEYGQNPSSSSGDNSREIPKATAEIKKTYT